MHSQTLISIPETIYLKRFFDAVDWAISAEINTSQIAYEEFLSSVLGRLLDGNSPYQALLSYSLNRLNSDLADCGTGNRLAVKFETNEHAKGFSGKVSHVDLGIVFRRENKLLGQTTEKAILVECKRLYPIKRAYTTRSRYEGFDERQYKALLKLIRRYGWGFIFYFLYNPMLNSFDAKSAQIIRALENAQFGSMTMQDKGINWREMRYYAERYGIVFQQASPVTSSTDADEIKDQMKKSVDSRPGIKVIRVCPKIRERSLSALDFVLEKQSHGTQDHP